MHPFTQQIEDLALAAPAAFARILLGHRGDPKARFIYSIAQKVGALLGSLFFAVMAGQVARSFANTADWATPIIIAAAFTAQDAAVTLIRKSKAKLNEYENER